MAALAATKLEALCSIRIAILKRSSLPLRFVSDAVTKNGAVWNGKFGQLKLWNVPIKEILLVPSSLIAPSERMMLGARTGSNSIAVIVYSAGAFSD